MSNCTHEYDATINFSSMLITRACKKNERRREGRKERGRREREERGKKYQGFEGGDSDEVVIETPIDSRCCGAHFELVVQHQVRVRSVNQLIDRT